MSFVGILFTKFRFGTGAGCIPVAASVFGVWGTAGSVVTAEYIALSFRSTACVRYFIIYFNKKPEHGSDRTMFRLFVMSIFIHSFLPKIFQKYVHAPVHPK